MPRLFVGIDLPSDIKESLLTLSGGVPGARWQSAEQLHLTLRFIGDTEPPSLREIETALGHVHSPPFELRLKGVGQFGDKRPHVLWAGLDKSPPLLHLAAKIEQALQKSGLPPETRKFAPHVTVARLKNPSRDRVFRYLSEHAFFQTRTFDVEEFHLYESHLGSTGAIYQIVSSFNLAAPAHPTALPRTE